jgi:hypothetical protein
MREASRWKDCGEARVGRDRQKTGELRGQGQEMGAWGCEGGREREQAGDR